MVETGGLENRFGFPCRLHNSKQIPLSASDLRRFRLHSGSFDFTGFDPASVAFLLHRTACACKLRDVSQVRPLKEQISGETLRLRNQKRATGFEPAWENDRRLKYKTMASKAAHPGARKSATPFESTRYFSEIGVKGIGGVGDGASRREQTRVQSTTTRNLGLTQPQKKQIIAYDIRSEGNAPNRGQD